MSNVNISKVEELSKQLGEPEWLLAWRKSRALLAETFPKEEKYGIGISGLTLSDAPDFSSYANYQVTPSKGLELYTWKEAIMQEEIAPILERLLGNALLPDASSSLLLLGQSLFRTGLVVYVQPTLDDQGKHKEETLEIKTTLPLGSSADVVIVIAKEGARFSLKNFLKGGEDTSVFARTMIVLTEGDARVEVYGEVEGVRGFVTLENIALVSPHASCNWTEDPQAPIRYRSHTNSLLLGEEARSEILHVLLGTANASYDIWAGAEHRASNTHSRVYGLGLGADTSKIIYRGVIDMKKGVEKVDGAQEGKFLIISPNAEIDAIPELDIASKDVASSHKLSVSHIRDSDLFYAKTRGISEASARALAIEGFFGALFHQIKKDEMLEQLRTRISALTKE